MEIVEEWYIIRTTAWLLDTPRMGAERVRVSCGVQRVIGGEGIIFKTYESKFDKVKHIDVTEF